MGNKNLKFHHLILSVVGILSHKLARVEHSGPMNFFSISARLITLIIIERNAVKNDIFPYLLNIQLSLIG